MPVTHTPFAYTFGDYANGDYAKLEGRPRHRLGLVVRRGLKRLTDPLARLSASGRQTLRSLAFDFELSEINFELDLTALGQYLNDQAEAFDRRLHSLRPADLTTIRRYLSRRRLLVRYLSQLPGRTVRHTFSQSEALRERALAFVQMQWEQIQQVRPLEKFAELTEDDRLLLPGRDGNPLLPAQFLSKPDSPDSSESK